MQKDVALVMVHEVGKLFSRKPFGGGYVQNQKHQHRGAQGKENDHRQDDPKRGLAALILAVTVLVIRFGHLRFPYDEHPEG